MPPWRFMTDDQKTAATAKYLAWRAAMRRAHAK
jgi:hypothetical protein